MDWVEWIALFIGLFSAIGVGYLIFQTFYDVFPRLSYKLQHEKFLALGGNQGAGRSRLVVLNFTIWNRTSRDATLQCDFSPAPEVKPPVKTYWTLIRAQFFDKNSNNPLSARGFVVPANTGKELVVQGELPPDMRGPTTVVFSIQDDRIGRRKWKRVIGFKVPGPKENHAKARPPIGPGSGSGP